jgi:hypothetical protein
MLDDSGEQRMHRWLPIVVDGDQTSQDRVLGKIRHASEQLDQIVDRDGRQLREPLQKGRVGRRHGRQ